MIHRAHMARVPKRSKFKVSMVVYGLSGSAVMIFLSNEATRKHGSQQRRKRCVKEMTPCEGKYTCMKKKKHSVTKKKPLEAKV